MIDLRRKFDRYPNAKRPHDKLISKLENKVIEKYGHVCEICGHTDPTWIPVLHHRDFNPGNNNILNIMPVCWACHGLIHSIFPNWRYLTDDEIRKILKDGRKILGTKEKKPMMMPERKHLDKILQERETDKKLENGGW